MIPKIKSVTPQKDYTLHVIFDDGKSCCIEQYKALVEIAGFFEQVQLDKSRTCVFWNDYIDLPSDAIYEYGEEI